ncbi:helix-hairpin-helix domain-containing protein [Guyparkeria hydrothermalis]|uniref:ComEA family DNA-binding protein n=1 Tax=Guyparkeria hydrothermalis TaxID=923 RepID=UPI0020212C24|nr:helix-hairpin-helix domain-containing protein [Guyparkeria hydrothermalis]MCL7750722.1 helix-hairpin-helix domain-containing protein [Guyparkeria hydrothermalis]
MKGLTHSVRAATIGAALLLAPPAFAAEPLNINEASEAELVTLNGIGPVYAERIVDYRSEHGRFESVDQLAEVKGIGAKTIATIKDEVAVGK